MQAVSQMITDDWSDDEDGDEPLSSWFPQVACVLRRVFKHAASHVVGDMLHGPQADAGQALAMLRLAGGRRQVHLVMLWCISYLGHCIAGTGFVAGSWRKVV
jgi:hypothetical protein